MCSGNARGSSDPVGAEANEIPAVTSWHRLLFAARPPNERCRHAHQIRVAAWAYPDRKIRARKETADPAGREQSEHITSCSEGFAVAVSPWRQRRGITRSCRAGVQFRPSGDSNRAPLDGRRRPSESSAGSHCSVSLMTMRSRLCWVLRNQFATANESPGPPPPAAYEQVGAARWRDYVASVVWRILGRSLYPRVWGGAPRLPDLPSELTRTVASQASSVGTG